MGKPIITYKEGDMVREWCDYCEENSKLNVKLRGKIKQLEAEKDILQKSEVCGEIEMNAIKAERDKFKQAIEEAINWLYEINPITSESDREKAFAELIMTIKTLKVILQKAIKDNSMKG